MNGADTTMPAIQEIRDAVKRDVVINGFPSEDETFPDSETATGVRLVAGHFFIREHLEGCGIKKTGRLHKERVTDENDRFGYVVEDVECTCGGLVGQQFTSYDTKIEDILDRVVLAGGTS